MRTSLHERIVLAGREIIASPRAQSPTPGASLRETLISAGLEYRLAGMLAEMPHKIVQVDPRRPFREAGSPRNQVIFVRSGNRPEFNTDNQGLRQIVAL